MGDHLAVFGNVVVVRAFCSDCDGYYLVARDGEFLCCGAKYKREPRRIKREVEPENTRRLPPKADREDILKQQGNCCAYCDRRFGARVAHRRRKETLRPCWDHLVPFSYAQNNDGRNFVAACQICNGRKAAMMFQTMEEARVYLQNLVMERDIVSFAANHTRLVDATRDSAAPTAGLTSGTASIRESN